MSRRITAALCTLLLTLTSFVAVGAEWSPAQVRAILAERIDKQAQSVGIVVGLIDGQGSSFVSYGRLSKTDERAPNGKTVFEIGSISKVFTSILLADMVLREKLHLDDPVQKFLPDSVRVPSRDGAAVTLYHLATHTSGLPRMPDNFAPKDPANPYADYTVEQMYAFLAGVELSGKPGAKAAYSNVGVGLLGHILALQAGTTYEALMRERIAGPLKMTDTVITLTPQLRERLAQGHDATLAPVANWDIPTLAGAGALRSTVDDMLLFLAANLGRTDSPIARAMEETQRSREDFSGPEMRIGLGWLIRKAPGGTIHWHNGGTGGYHSFAGFDREHKRGVVVLSNSANDIDDIGFHLIDAELPLAKSKTASEAVPFDPKIFDDYVGRYQLAPGFILSVTRDGGRFYVQATGQGMLEVFPESDSRFFATAVEAAISFVRGADGKVSHLVLHQGGVDQKAEWLDAAVPAAAPTIRVPEQTLDKYVGRYELQPGFVIGIRRDGAKLLAQATAQPEFEIFAESETKFFYRVVDAQITFQTDEKGTTAGLILHQNGRDMPAKRLAN